MNGNRTTATPRQVLRSGAALAAGALASTLPMPAIAAERPFRLGYVSPRTGPLAPFGEADSFVLSTAGQLLAKGVAVGGKTIPVEIVVKDSQSNPNRAAEVAADLILKSKIDLMLVASTPETTNPVSDQCELNETPCLSTVAPWQPWFFARGGKPETGFEYTYHYFWGLEDVIAVFTSGRRSRRTRSSAASSPMTAMAMPGVTRASAFRRCWRSRATS